MCNIQIGDDLLCVRACVNLTFVKRHQTASKEVNVLSACVLCTLHVCSLAGWLVTTSRDQNQLQLVMISTALLYSQSDAYLVWISFSDFVVVVALRMKCHLAVGVACHHYHCHSRCRCRCRW